VSLYFGGEAGSSSNTMWLCMRPTSMTSFILIHPPIWPQYTNITDRETGQRSDSIQRTVLQTVVQKRSLSCPVSRQLTVNVQVDPHINRPSFLAVKKTSKIQDLHIGRPPLYTIFQVMWLMLLTESHAMQQCKRPRILRQD